MSNQTQIIKSVIPTIVKNFSSCFEIDFSIKLFGVKVFAFHWPPQSEQEVEPSKNPLC